MIIHLFKKVYLNLDWDISLEEDRIVVSTNQGYGLSNALLDYDYSYPKKLVAYGPSIEYLIGENTEKTEDESVYFEEKITQIGLPKEKFASDYIDFFTKVYEHSEQTGKPLTIHADLDSYMSLIMNYYKIIFPNLDFKSLSRILKSCYYRTTFIKQLNTYTKKSTFTEQKYLGYFYANMLERMSEFEKEYDLISFDSKQKELEEFYDKIKENLSIEYYISSYIYDGSKKEQLKKIVMLMIYRHSEEILEEHVMHFLTAFLRKPFQRKMGLKEYNLDNAEEIFTDPLVEKFLKTSVWRFSEEFERINFSNYTKEDLDEIKATLEKINDCFYGLTEESDLVDLLRFNYSYYLLDNKISDDELQSIINKESETDNEMSMWTAEDQNTINVYLIQEFFDIKNQSKVDSLKPFRLR